MPVVIKPLADRHSGTRRCSGRLRPQTDAYPVTAIMLLKVSRNTPAKTYMPDRDDSQDRQPVPQDKLIILQKACQETDDALRWLLALISDTGMRLSEAAGLHRDDIILDVPTTPHQPHSASVARLKTKSSARHIPLVERLYGQHRGSCSMTVAMPSHTIAMARYAKPTQPALHSING